MGRYLKSGAKVFFPLLGAVLFKIPNYARHKKKYSIETRHNYMKNLINKINDALGCEFIILGLDNLPKENGYAIYPNHISNFDAFALFEIINSPTSFVGKLELKKHAIIRDAFLTLDALFMDRNDLRQSLTIMKEVEESLKNKEMNWVIFPEGGRLKDPVHNLREFHHGSFRPPVKASVPIVPIAISGTQRVFKTKPVLKKYPVIISILPPLYPSDYQGLNTKDIASIVSDMIEKEISYHLRKLDQELMMKYNPDKYIFNKIG